MKHVSEYRSPSAAARLLEAVSSLSLMLDRGTRFMEVCGTHTMSAARAGLRDLLPSSVGLLSGPGCPVCVTPPSFISKAIEYSKNDKVIIATFGDMMKVPSGGNSLEKQRGLGSDIRVVYSPLDALSAAEENRDKKVVFLGVGFETTAPAVAASVEEAKARGAGNFFVLCGHKTMPRAMAALVSDPGIQIDGFICPGHVSAVIGSRPYEFLAVEHKLPCVIAGFEPLDIIQAVYMLSSQVVKAEARVEIQYGRAVRSEGNKRALELLDRVFEPADSEWRGLGAIPLSGLKLREKYSDFNAEERIPVNAPDADEPAGCICGEILKGKSRPEECGLFGKACSPANPLGACMVSTEGACAARYRYGGAKNE